MNAIIFNLLTFIPKPLKSQNNISLHIDFPYSSNFATSVYPNEMKIYDHKRFYKYI